MPDSVQESLNIESYASDDIFAPASFSVTKNNQFLQAFGQGSTNRPSASDRFLNSGSSASTSRRGSSGTTNVDEHSFLDFQARPESESSFQAQLDSSGSSSMPGWAVKSSFTHPLSPARSVVLPSHGWSYSQQPSMPGNILTDMQSNKTYREQYGQVTPPDDDIDSLFDDQLREQANYKDDKRSTTPLSGGHPGDTTFKKTVAPQPPPKRTRKYNSRKSTESNQDANQVPDTRRSKFLERNRVAASKCRQKKKEWTQKLETRARDLQKDNHNLNMMIESLNEELCVLKTQCAEHSNCECHDIQQIMNGSISDDPGSFQQEPIASNTSILQSRDASIAATNSKVTSPSPIPKDIQAAKEVSNNERTLEALLTSSIEHDTSEKAIAHKTGT